MPLRRLMRSKTLAGMMVLGMCLAATGIPFGGLAEALVQDVVDTREENEVVLYVGDLVALKVYSLTRIAVEDPAKVDVANADVDEVLLIGRKVGETAVFVWDEYGKRKLTARVLEDDLDVVEQEARTLLDTAGFEGVTLHKNIAQGKIVVTGSLREEEQKRLEKILRPLAKKILYLQKEALPKLVQIDVQISELSETLTEAMGIQWTTGQQGLTLPYTEALPNFDGSLGSLFKIGDFARTAAITATVNALISEGKGRILSKPSIVVSSGKKAKFLVGGEIPVRSTTTSLEGNALTENITFTEYGISVVVTPNIREGDKIDLELGVDVKDIDAANAVGENVAFTTRKASTRLLLNNEQTIVLAGMIKHNRADTYKRVPFLSSLPLVGALFRSRSTSPKSDLELVISLTPRILSQKPVGDEESVVSSMGEGPLQEDVRSPGTGVAEEAQVISAGEGPSGTEAGTRDAETDSKDEGVPQPPTETPASLAASVDTGPETKAAVAAYVRDLQKDILDAVSYPYSAKEKGWSGTVVLKLEVLSDGTLKDVRIKESSGIDIFDKDAVNTAQIVAPFAPFPPEVDLEEMEVTVPIAYGREGVLREDDGSSLGGEEDAVTADDDASPVEATAP